MQKSRIGSGKKPPIKKVIGVIPSNWRVPHTYPKFNDLDMKHWRWEFIRRNPAYQKDWDLLNRQVATDTRQWKNATLQEKLKTVLNQYGLTIVLPNPVHSHPPFLQFQSPAEQVHIGGTNKNGRVIRIPIPPVHGAVIFDLTKPLPPQLTLAKYSLQRAQEDITGGKQSRRKHPSHWPMLLRILDARAQGVTYAHIGQQLLDIEAYDSAATRAKQLHTEALHLSRNFPF